MNFIKDIIGNKSLYTNGHLLGLALLILAILLLIFSVANRYAPDIEGFQQTQPLVVKEGTDVYDGFYSRIYSQIMDDGNRCLYEVREIMRNSPVKYAAILDIGCGDAAVVEHMDLTEATYTGVDISPHMLKLADKRAKKHANRRNIQLIEGDILDPNIVENEQYTHVLALYFSLYNIEDKRKFFMNAFGWLKAGGYLAIHLVNRDKFDPIVNAANPFYVISPQKYAKERITKSHVKFDDFDYKAKFDLNGDIATFNETMKDHGGHIRRNKHILYMEPQSQILAMAKEAGFDMKGKIDMAGCGYEYQYIYILVKPSFG